MGKRLYVGNLSYDTTNASLRDAFVAAGHTPKDVHVMMDRDTGRPRGFGFVELATDEAALAAAAALNGVELEGRELNVNEAQERKSRPSGGDRY